MAIIMKEEKTKEEEKTSESNNQELINKLIIKCTKQEELLCKINEILIKHIDSANEELQIILRDDSNLEYKNQCSHDFEIVRKNIEIIINKYNKLMEELR